MEQLLEDYKRRLASVRELQIEWEKDSHDHVRLKTKESCYRTFISELEREIKLKEKE